MKSISVHNVNWLSQYPWPLNTWAGWQSTIGYMCLYFYLLLN